MCVNIPADCDDDNGDNKEDDSEVKDNNDDYDVDSFSLSSSLAYHYSLIGDTPAT